MGLNKLLPRSIRMALFYAKAKKLVANNSFSREEKIERIHKLEKSWIGDITGIIRGTGEQDAAIVIGCKDVASIYLQLQAPDDALRYLNAVENVFPLILEIKSQSEAILEGFLFSLYHRGNAYAQKGQVDLCAQQFDRLNLTLNEQISNNPANARLQDVYKYFNKQIFNTYINIAENYPNQKQEVYRICLNQLKTFDKRDPGNEQIQGYIGRFS